MDGAACAGLKVDRLRWVVLAVFFCYCAVNSFHWVQYTIVSDLVARFYRVPVAHVDWTSYMFMAALVLFMLPACFVLDKKGMRWSLVLGAQLMAAGSWLKVVAVSRAMFPAVLLAQLLAGLAQLFMLGTPARLAAVWFPPDELSTACAVAVFGNQLGLAAGFLAPPLLVRPHDDPADIGHDLKMLTLGVAASSSLIAALTVLLFKDRPELPPSPAQAQERAGCPEVTCQGFARALRRLWANGNYRLMLACNGIANGSLNVVVTVLSPVVLSHFPDGQEFAGRVGVVIILAGLLGCVVFGALLDRTHKYKEFMLGAYSLMAISTAIFGFILRTKNPTYVYISSGVLGIFLVGFMPIALEMSAEVTYPESESTVGNLLFIPSNVLGIAMSMAFTEIMQRWGDLSAILFVCASLAAGALLASFVGRDYRRLAANSGDKPAPSRGKHELIVN